MTYSAFKGGLLLQEIPLMSQVLVSGNEQHTQEQLWLLQLLALGLRAPHDIPLYR